jgi:pimeloyl-ACP methyl ester carboxylesterase
MLPVIRRAYCDNIFGQMHYRIARPETAPLRPTLLCLHQTPRSGWEWEPIIPGLAVDRVVVAPDTPGYGMSDPPPAAATIEDFGAAALHLLDQLESAGAIPPGPVDVIGYHTGSVTATHLASNYPDRIRRVIAIGLAAYDAATRAGKLERIDVFPTPKANDLSHVSKLWDLMETMVDPRASPQWRHRALAEALMTGERLPWGFMAVYRFDFQAAMSRVEQPVLVINLEDDLDRPTRENAHRYPNGRRVDLPGVAHGVMWLETDRIVSLVRDFLDA